MAVAAEAHHLVVVVLLTLQLVVLIALASSVAFLGACNSPQATSMVVCPKVALVDAQCPGAHCLWCCSLPVACLGRYKVQLLVGARIDVPVHYICCLVQMMAVQLVCC